MLTRAVAVAVVLVVMAACGGPEDAPPPRALATGPASTGPVSTRATPPPPSAVPVPGATRPTDETSTSAPGSAPSTQAPPPPAAGCGLGAGDWVSVGGRRFLVATAGTSGRAVVVLHGFTGSPAAIETTSGWTAFGATVDATVVYPEGTPAPGVGWGWSAGTTRYSTTGVDDVSFVADVVEALADGGCAERGVLLTGESNGAAMALRAWCGGGLAGAVTVVAPVIPAVGEGTMAACDLAPPVPLVAVAGTADAVAPWDGTADGALLPQETWFATVAAAVNGCGAGDPGRTAAPGATIIRPAGCEVRTELVAVHGAPHTWPGGPTGTAGLDPGDFPTTAYLWEAFAGP